MAGAGRKGRHRGTPKLTENQVAEIRRRLEAGEQGKKLAAEYDMSKASISKIRQNKTWVHVDDCKAPEGRAKLTENQVREIRAMLANGDTNPSIAAAFEVTPSLIRHIRSGKLWKGVV